MGETNGKPDVDREALWAGFAEEMREMTRRACLFDDLVEALEKAVGHYNLGAFEPEVRALLVRARKAESDG